MFFIIIHTSLTFILHDSLHAITNFQNPKMFNQNPEKTNQKQSNCLNLIHTKSPIFSSVVYSVLVLFIVGAILFSNAYLELNVFRSSTVTKNGVLNSQLDSKNHNNVQISKQIPLAPPKNTTSKERMVWLQHHLQDFEIFKSTNLSQRFDSRVSEFFDETCEENFFMTWISPAESFGRRVILAIESVFKSHPKGCLMILSPSMDSPQGNAVLQPLIDRGFKILPATPDFTFLVENTPAETWLEEIKRCVRDPGRIPLSQNLSNLMRLAVLYKYGGIYLDTDVIVLKSFKGLKNSIGAQSIDAKTKNWTRLNNAVLIFDKNHPILIKFMEEFASTFDGNVWGHNGPYLVTRVARRVEGQPGFNFTVLPMSAFYPVNWVGIWRMFKVPESKEELRWLESRMVEINRDCYGLHLWNKISGKFLIEKGSAIEKMILDHCVMC